jgi:hypothetical protein
MFCPLRFEETKELEDYGDCLTNRCEWWIPEEKDYRHGRTIPGHCAIHYLALIKKEDN